MKKRVVVPSKEQSRANAVTFEQAQHYVPPTGMRMAGSNSRATPASTATYTAGIMCGPNRGRARRRTK